MDMSILDLLGLPHGEAWLGLAVLGMRTLLVAVLFGAAALLHARIRGSHAPSVRRILLAALVWSLLCAYGRADHRLLVNDLRISNLEASHE